MSDVPPIDAVGNGGKGAMAIRPQGNFRVARRSSQARGSMHFAIEIYHAPLLSAAGGCRAMARASSLAKTAGVCRIIELRIVAAGGAQRSEAATHRRQRKCDLLLVAPGRPCFLRHLGHRHDIAGQREPVQARNALLHLIAENKIQTPQRVGRGGVFARHAAGPDLRSLLAVAAQSLGSSSVIGATRCKV
ncbi:MAG: hypothetical protein JNK46_16820 [Methylobacteriaceae bacterium]|nr:hypothetical protein [Methylobacteriaceae bacterium]